MSDRKDKERKEKKGDHKQNQSTEEYNYDESAGYSDSGLGARIRRGKIFPRLCLAYEALHEEFAKATRRTLNIRVNPVSRKEIEQRLQEAMPLTRIAPKPIIDLTVDLILAYLVEDFSFTSSFSKLAKGETEAETVKAVVDSLNEIVLPNRDNQRFTDYLVQWRKDKIAQQLRTTGISSPVAIDSLVEGTLLSSISIHAILEDKPISLVKKINGVDNPLYDISPKEFSESVEDIVSAPKRDKNLVCFLGVFFLLLTVAGIAMLLSDGTLPEPSDADTIVQKIGYGVSIAGSISLFTSLTAYTCLSDFLMVCGKRSTYKQLKQIEQDIRLLMYLRHFEFPSYREDKRPSHVTIEVIDEKENIGRTNSQSAATGLKGLDEPATQPTSIPEIRISVSSQPFNSSSATASPASSAALPAAHLFATRREQAIAPSLSPVSTSSPKKEEKIKSVRQARQPWLDRISITTPLLTEQHQSDDDAKTLKAREQNNEEHFITPDYTDPENPRPAKQPSGGYGSVN